ncbi:34154_t:CDS:2, partial [Racocetra persica]
MINEDTDVPLHNNPQNAKDTVDVLPSFPLPDSPQRAKDTLDVIPAFPLPDSPQRTNSSQSKKLTPLEKANKIRQKVFLEPGHSALDWARLKNSDVDLT